MEKKAYRLIDDLRRRERTAQERLLTLYGQMVFRQVSRIVTRLEDAEEVYQDVFVKALHKIDTYDDSQATLATWLSRIAYNESLNFVRGKKPNIVYLDDRDTSIDTWEAPDDAPPDEQTIEQLEQALAMLPPHEQAIVSMFYYDNQSLADIAYVTGSIPSTVGSQLSRIRKKLYRIIKTL